MCVCIYIYIYIYICQLDIDIMVSVRQWPGRSGLNPRSSHAKDSKWYLMLSCLTLSIIRYVSRVKWSNPGNGVVPSPTPRCSSYRKGSPRVNLDYGPTNKYIVSVLVFIRASVVLSCQFLLF